MITFWSTVCDDTGIIDKEVERASKLRPSIRKIFSGVGMREQGCVGGSGTFSGSEQVAGAAYSIVQVRYNRHSSSSREVSSK